MVLDSVNEANQLIEKYESSGFVVKQISTSECSIGYNIHRTIAILFEKINPDNYRDPV